MVRLGSAALRRRVPCWRPCGGWERWCRGEGEGKRRRVPPNARRPCGGLGEGGYNFKTGRFEVRVDGSAANKPGSLGDELTHAHQYETGQLGYLLQNDGTVKSTGYDMEDEVASKRAYIEATNAYNSAYGTNYELSATVKAFERADTGPVPDGATREGLIESYFQSDPSARQYLGLMPEVGKQMGSHIAGNGGLPAATFDKAMKDGGFKAYTYREAGSDGKMKTVNGER
jgi:hypothetical protein